MKYLFTLFICSIISYSFAQKSVDQPYAQVEVSSFNVIEGEVFALSVNIYNDKAKSPPLISTHPSLSMVASSHQFQQKNRQLVDSYIYQVSIKKSGVITLPAIEVYTQKGGLIKTAPLKFIAQDFDQVNWKNLVIDQQSLTYGTLLSSSNLKPYVGQMANSQLKVLLPSNINIEEFRELNMKFNNIAADSFSLKNGPLNAVNSIRVDGNKYQIYNFSTQFSCLNPGEALIGDGSLTLAVRAVNRSMGIFQTYTTINLNFELPQITLQAKNLPDGKPANFTGIIGDFKLTSNANLENYKNYTDVINVTFNLEGEGNFNNSIMPSLSELENWQTYPTQIVNTIAQNNYHNITFHQIIRSNQPQKAIPSYSFNYFNPKTGTYETAKSKPIQLPNLVINSATALANLNTQKLNQPLGLLIAPLGWKHVMMTNLSNEITLILTVILAVLAIYLVALIIIIFKKNQNTKPYKQLKVELFHTLNHSITRQSFYQNFLHHLDSYLQKNEITELPSSLNIKHEQWLAYAYDKDDQTLLNRSQANTAIKLTLQAIQKTNKTKSKPVNSKKSTTLSLLITFSLVMMSGINSWSEASNTYINTSAKNWDKAFELYELNKPNQALQLYQEIIQSEQTDNSNLGYVADLYFNLGVCYEKLQRIDLAHLSYRYALSLQPSHPTSLHNLAILTDKQKFATLEDSSSWISALSTYKSWIISLAFVFAIITGLHFTLSKKATHRYIYLSILLISCIILLGSIILYVYNYFYKENVNSDSSHSLAIIISTTSTDYFESASSQSTRLGTLAAGSPIYLKVQRQPYSLIQPLTNQENEPVSLGWLDNQMFCLISDAPSLLLKPFSSDLKVPAS